MKDFEQHLQNQRPRQIPESWRNEILSHARDSVAHETSGIRDQASGFKRLSSLISHLSTALLWPHPKAWTGLAAVWLVIGWLNWSTMQPETSMLAVRRPDASSISPGQLASLTEQRRLQRELLGLVPANTSEPMDRPKPQPGLKPQSAVPQPCGFA